MKTSCLTILGGLASGYAAYYIVLVNFNVLQWLSTHELTTDQRIFVIELGFSTFLLGVVLGGAVYWRVRLQRL